MKRSDLERLHDARDFARYAQDDAGGLSAEILADARQPQHAALFDLMIVGEALNGVSTEVKSAAPDLPWQAVVDLRNFVVHAYWQIDLEIVADVIEHRLEPLIDQRVRLIEFVEHSDQ